VRRFDVAEEGGQRGDAGVDVDALAVRVEEAVR